ncbi:MAG: class I tRNA ligase family protein, partial [Desulfocucumaceae bacterium]
QMTESYRKIRNTCRFLVGNLYDFDPAAHRVGYRDLPEIDRWALLKLQKTIGRVLSGYRDYEYHVVYHAVHNFCTVDMSALYLDIIKDRLYTSAPSSWARRSAQTVMCEVLSALVRLLAPVLAFTSEEIWRYVPKSGSVAQSVQLCDMPVVNEDYLDPALEKKWDRLLDLRAVVTRALETARQDKLIGNSLEALVELYVTDEIHHFLEPMKDELDTLFIVSGVTITPGQPPEGAVSGEDITGFAVVVHRALGEKCERCWNFHQGVGRDQEHPALCPRCAEVVRGLPAAGC